MPAKMLTKMIILMAWRCGSNIGAPDMVPCNLAKAITEPEKVIAPMATPSDISTRLAVIMAPFLTIPNASGDKNAAQATNTAAMPTSEWKAATNCGISVMAMRRAITAPIMPPMATPAAIMPKLSSELLSRSVSVVATAMAMPAMPK